MLKRKRHFFGALICLALLFATPLAVTWPAISNGDVLYNLDALTVRAPWQEARTVQADAPAAPGVDELIERHYPWYAFINMAGQSGQLPLWYPFEGFGAPFLALWRTRTLSPFSLPLYFFPFGMAIGISVFSKLVVAGLAAYYAARRFQFTPPFALLVAIPFQMSGLFLAAHWHPISDVAPLFPFMLPCLQRLLLGDRRAWPYMALLVGLMTLGGDPESLAAILAFMIVLVVVFGIRTYQRERIAGAFIWLVISSVVGLALAAVQLAPYFEFLSHGRLEMKSTAFFSFRDFSALLAPPILSDGAFAGQQSALWLPACLIGFLLIPLWLSLRPFAHRIRKRRIEAFSLAALLLPALAAIFGAWMRLIPGLSGLDATHFMIPLPLAFGLLAATAADEWVHLNAEKCKSVLGKLVWVLPLFWALGLLGTSLLLTLSPMPHGELLMLAPALVCMGVTLLILVVTLLWPQPSFTAVALALVTAALLWFVYQPHTRFTPEEEFAPETHFIQALCREDCRVAGTGRLRNWPLSPHGVAQVYSPSGISLDRTNRFMAYAEQDPELLRLTASSQLLLTKRDIQEHFAALRPVLNILEVFPSGAILLKDLQAHSRARVVYSARKSSPGESQPPLRASGPAIIESGALPETRRQTSSIDATIQSAGFNTVTVASDSTRPGILILADAWYPGWRATTQSNTTPIFPVDIAFRGVEVSEGSTEIAFEYRPESLRLGLYISSAAFLVILFGLQLLYRNRHVRKPV